MAIPWGCSQNLLVIFPFLSPHSSWPSNPHPSNCLNKSLNPNVLTIVIALIHHWTPQFLRKCLIPHGFLALETNPHRLHPTNQTQQLLWTTSLGSWRWSYRKPGRPSANRYLSSETARPTRWLCGQKNPGVLRMLMTTMLATRTQSSPSYCGSKGSPDLEKMTIDIWFPRYPQIWNLDNKKATSIPGPRRHRSWSLRHFRNSHCHRPRRATGPTSAESPGHAAKVGTRRARAAEVCGYKKKGTLGVDRKKKMIENPEDQAIQLFKIAIPYPAVRVLSKGRIELLSSPQAKMNIFFTSMPSGHTNFS